MKVGSDPQARFKKPLSAPQQMFVVPRLLRIPDAAHYIGGTNWFVEELIRGNKIRFLTVGKYRVIDTVDLDAWIERQKSIAVCSIDVAA
jgi:excisionase family DNA binding protein